MTPKCLFFFQVIVSFSAGASLLWLFLLFFHTFPNLCSWDNATSYGPWLEEGLKFITVLILIRIAFLTETTIPFIGMGFGFMEQLAFFINNNFSDRRIIVLWVHIILGLVMAYFFHLVLNHKSSSLRSVWCALALLIPVYLHLLYNILASLPHM